MLLIPQEMKETQEVLAQNESFYNPASPHYGDTDRLNLLALYDHAPDAQRTIMRFDAHTYTAVGPWQNNRHMRLKVRLC